MSMFDLLGTGENSSLKNGIYMMVLYNVEFLV